VQAITSNIHEMTGLDSVPCLALHSLVADYYYYHYIH